jgi:hypothetical protein
MLPQQFLQFDVILANKDIYKLHTKKNVLFNYGRPYLCAYWHKNRRFYITVYYTQYTRTCFTHVTFCFYLKTKSCLLSYHWHFSTRVKLLELTYTQLHYEPYETDTTIRLIYYREEKCSKWMVL